MRIWSGDGDGRAAGACAGACAGASVDVGWCKEWEGAGSAEVSILSIGGEGERCVLLFSLLLLLLSSLLFSLIGGVESAFGFAVAGSEGSSVVGLGEP